MLNRRDIVQGAAAVAVATVLPLPAEAVQTLSDAELEMLIRANAAKAQAGLIITADPEHMREGIAFFEEKGIAPIHATASVEEAKAILRERASEVAIMLTEGHDWHTVWLPFARTDMARYGHVAVARF